jgi:hypothetical protein
MITALFLTDVSGHFVGPIFRGQEFLTPGDGFLEGSVLIYLFSQRNAPEERSSLDHM